MESSRRHLEERYSEMVGVNSFPLTERGPVIVALLGGYIYAADHLLPLRTRVMMLPHP
jgi:hypothetical protein